MTQTFSCDRMSSNHTYSLHPCQFPGSDTVLKLCKKPLWKQGEGGPGWSRTSHTADPRITPGWGHRPPCRRNSVYTFWLPQNLTTVASPYLWALSRIPSNTHVLRCSVPHIKRQRAMHAFGPLIPRLPTVDGKYSFLAAVGYTSGCETQGYRGLSVYLLGGRRGEMCL